MDFLTIADIRPNSLLATSTKGAESASTTLARELSGGRPCTDSTNNESELEPVTTAADTYIEQSEQG
ncbi:hypothetical protein A6I85_00390 [Prescottella equi]|nr:hypothetical protein A6I85_00390 [Prescottella equi]